jgi:hypothetical protein
MRGRARQDNTRKNNEWREISVSTAKFSHGDKRNSPPPEPPSPGSPAISCKVFYVQVATGRSAFNTPHGAKMIKVSPSGIKRTVNDDLYSDVRPPAFIEAVSTYVLVAIGLLLDAFLSKGPACVDS